MSDGVLAERRRFLVAVVGLATLLFGAIHLVTGRWHDDHLVPAIGVAIPLVGIALATGVGDPPQSDGRVRLAWGAVAALAAATLFGGARYIDLSGGLAPVTEVGRVGQVVERHTPEGETVFALNALWAAVEADRAVPKGFEIIHHSLIRGPRERAERLHVVTPEMLIEILEQRETSTVVLTSADRYMIWKLGGAGTLARTLATIRKNYVEVAVFDNVGETTGATEVYTLRSS